MKPIGIILLIGLLLVSNNNCKARWGFFGHQRINRIAVFTLPIEMLPFYKKNIQYITENAVNPDRRRYAVKNEAPRHYIDLDVYGDSAAHKMPRYWDDAVAMYTEDTLQAYGIVPWHILSVKNWLTKAFENRDLDAILRLSADLGHYIGDSNVPLHTTVNYNGQLTDQYGIHGFWESRLPELFYDEYDLFTGRAEYVDNVQLRAWDAVTKAHLALDSVLTFEKLLSEQRSEDKKYSFEERGTIVQQVYSREFSRAYHTMLDGMVERQMKSSIKMIGDIWYTSWVDGGQPDLSLLMDSDLTEEEKAELEREIEEWKTRKFKSREHESGSQ
ncbi:MAG: zinc dependent phospholipase C family protein [Bacteroidota bacterium]